VDGSSRIDDRSVAVGTAFDAGTPRRLRKSRHCRRVPTPTASCACETGSGRHCFTGSDDARGRLAGALADYDPVATLPFGLSVGTGVASGLLLSAYIGTGAGEN